MYCSLYCLYDSRGTIYILSIDSRALAHFSLRLVRLIQFSRRDKHTEYRVESTSVFFTTACFDTVLLVARRGCKMDLTTSSHRLRRTIFPSRNTQHYSIVQSPETVGLNSLLPYWIRALPLRLNTLLGELLRIT